MCDPVSLGVASLVVGGVGIGMQAYGAYQQGQAQKAQYEYQAAVNRENAKGAQWQADDARVRGQAAEVTQRRKAGALLEQQKVALGGMGFDMTDQTGSAILSDTATLGEIDAQTIRLNASREAWGFEQQRRNFESNAAMSGIAGQNAATAGAFGATSSLFSGASSVADKWATYKDKGIL